MHGDDGHAPRRGHPRTRVAWPTIVVGTATSLALLTGTLLRAWFLFHLPITSDQAVVGLMADHYLHGHLTAFYWGQQYGGVEAYVVAAAFRVAGHSVTTLDAVPVVLSASAALLVWRITLRFVDDARLAGLAGALAWAAPLPAIYKSTVEYGLRGVTLVCGLALVLVSLRVLDGESRVRAFVVLGAVAGLGWWSLPEIVYFVLPAALLLAAAVRRVPHDARWWATRIGAAGAAFVVGALPWLWANAQSGLASLDSSRFSGTASPLNPGYRGRLGIFFRYALPVQLGLRPVGLGFGHDSTSKWLVGTSSAAGKVGLALLLVTTGTVIAVAIVLGLARGGRARAIAAGLIALPFLTALQPGTWYWQDGRYLVYLGPLLAIAVAVACEELTRIARVEHALGAVALSVVVVACIVVTLASFRQAAATGPSSLLANWRRPDRDTVAAIASLRAQGVESGYANYWVAYKLDFLSRERLVVTVGAAETDRSAAIDGTVRRSAHPAWLFVPPARLGRGFDQFGATANIRGPDGLAESTFTARLDRLGVSYRTLHAGLLDAVVPARAVTFADLRAAP